MPRIDMDLIKFDEKGLVQVVVQDATTAEILMSAWANEESLRATEATGYLTLWSRSREQLWKKGETSGNTIKVREMRIDCDGDTILALSEPTGPACHTGERSCFFRSLWGDENSTESSFLGRLWRSLEERKDMDPEKSYTARLLAGGPMRVAQKVGEEGVETALAAAAGDRGAFCYEAADLIYHLLVACVCTKVSLNEVLKELSSRHKERSTGSSREENETKSVLEADPNV